MMRAATRRSDAWTRFLTCWIAGVLLFLYAPLVVVALYSFNRDRFLLNWTGFGTAAYQTAFGNDAVRQAVTTSLVAGAGSAVLSMVIGGLAGFAWARRGGSWTRPFSALVMLVLVAPEIVVGIAYLIFFVAIGLSSGLARLILSHSVFSSAVVALLVRARLTHVDAALEEAAADLGALPHRVFVDITLPIMRPALLAGGLLAFSFSMDDVVISAFVSTAGTVPLPVYIFSALRTGLKTEHAAIAVLALAATLTVMGVAFAVMRRAGGSGSQMMTEWTR